MGWMEEWDGRTDGTDGIDGRDGLGHLEIISRSFQHVFRYHLASFRDRLGVIEISFTRRLEIIVGLY